MLSRATGSPSASSTAATAPTNWWPRASAARSCCWRDRRATGSNAPPCRAESLSFGEPLAQVGQRRLVVVALLLALGEERLGGGVGAQTQARERRLHAHVERLAGVQEQRRERGAAGLVAQQAQGVRSGG